MTRGRPSSYTEETAREICARIESGMSLNQITKMDDMPESPTVYSWFAKFPDFLRNYETAMANRAHAIFEEMLDIADNPTGDTKRDRLRIDTRKWALSRMNPKKYGDKSAIELTGPGGGPLQSITSEMDPQEAARLWQASISDE